MSRKPLVDIDEVMGRLQPALGMVHETAMRAVLENVVAKYEAALDRARKDGFDAAVADGDVLDEWKERCWQAEQRAAELERMVSLEMVQAVNAEANSEPVPGFFNAENMDYLHKMVHTNRQNIGHLSARVAMLEREQRKEQGTL